MAIFAQRDGSLAERSLRKGERLQVCGKMYVVANWAELDDEITFAEPFALEDGEPVPPELREGASGETWALLERVAGAGLLAPGGLLHGLVHPNQATGESWRLVSLGGGPGFELLAADWFVKWWVASGGKVRHPPRNSTRKSARDSCAIRAMR